MSPLLPVKATLSFTFGKVNWSSFRLRYVVVLMLYESGRWWDFYIFRKIWKCTSLISPTAHPLSSQFSMEVAALLLAVHRWVPRILRPSKLVQHCLWVHFPGSHPWDCGTGAESLQTSPKTVRGAGQSMRRILALVQTCLLCSKGAGKIAQVLVAPQ